MASIVKKRNKYYAIVDFGYKTNPKTGKLMRDQRWFSKSDAYPNGFKNKKDAEAGAVEIEYQRNNNTFVLPDNITFGEFLLYWVNKKNKHSVTYENYLIIIEKHIIPKLGNIELQKIKPSDIDNFYDWLRMSGRLDGKGGLKVNSINSIHRVIAAALNYAYKKDLVKKNIIKSVTVPTREKTKITIYNGDGVGTLLSFVSKHKNRDNIYEPTINLAVYMWLRKGEILGLEWDKINFETNEITIDQSLSATDGIMIIKTPKTDSGKRTWIAPLSIMVLLKKIKIKQAESKLRLGEYYKSKEIVFCYKEDEQGNLHPYYPDLVCCRYDGRPYNPRSFSADFSRFIKLNNLPKITFHGLRHTGITRAIESGKIPIEIISKLAGHKSIKVTVDTYGHLTKDMRLNVANVMEEINYFKGI